MARLESHRKKPDRSLKAKKDIIVTAANNVRDNRSRGTARAYATDWNMVSQCRTRRAAGHHPNSRSVLTAEGKLKRAPATLDRRLAAILLMHIGPDIFLRERRSKLAT